MLVSDIIIAMTKPKKKEFSIGSILHKHIEDNPQKFIGGGGSVCLYITLHNSKQPIWESLTGTVWCTRSNSIPERPNDGKKAITDACQYFIDPFFGKK